LLNQWQKSKKKKPEDKKIEQPKVEDKKEKIPRKNSGGKKDKKPKEKKVLAHADDEIDSDFSLVLSKVINDNMESAKEEILKKH